MVAVVLTCACSGRSLVRGADAGVDRIATPAPGSDGSALVGDGGTPPVQRDAGMNTVDPSHGCPAVDEPADEAPAIVQPARAPTRVPFSCQPMPATFLFPPPGPDVPGLFTRCASFEVGAASAVAVSPDGRLAALATADGLARVVEVASRRVIAVLASPRAMIDYLAFAPGGSTVLTLARGQREVTLWRTADWTPVWRVSLPGIRYYHMFGGGIAFSPDGSAAVVSPGADSFLLDVATGAIRATRPTPYGAVTDVGYGWNGRRIVLVEPSLDAHCIHDPNGGRVVILDPETLAPIASVDYGSYPMVTGQPQFRASPTDDLVLVPDPEPPNRLTARKLSDGSALPAPALATMPLAFMPDGQTALVFDGGALLRVRVADAAVTSVVMLGDSGPLGVSADGSLVAFGGKGSGLLRVWNSAASAGGFVQTICSADEPASPLGASLSRDGARLAIGTSAGVRVLRTVDGATIASLPTPGRPILSPSGTRMVTVSLNDRQPMIVSRIADGAVLASVAQDQWLWANVAFSPREDRLYAGGSDYRSNQYVMAVVELSSPGSSTIKSIPQYTALLGVSNGCPVLYEGERGVWRSCGACDDPAIASGGTKYDATQYRYAVLSSDGKYLGIAGSPGVTLWRMPPEAATVATIGQRASEAGWQPAERPAAISAGGTGMLTGTWVNPACYSGPAFEADVHDTASGALLDELPAFEADGALRTIASGAQLWCAR